MSAWAYLYVKSGATKSTKSPTNVAPSLTLSDVSFTRLAGILIVTFPLQSLYSLL